MEIVATVRQELTMAMYVNVWHREDGRKDCHEGCDDDATPNI